MSASTATAAGTTRSVLVVSDTTMRVAATPPATYATLLTAAEQPRGPAGLTVTVLDGTGPTRWLISRRRAALRRGPGESFVVIDCPDDPATACTLVRDELTRSRLPVSRGLVVDVFTHHNWARRLNLVSDHTTTRCAPIAHHVFLAENLNVARWAALGANGRTLSEIASAAATIDTVFHRHGLQLTDGSDNTFNQLAATWHGPPETLAELYLGLSGDQHRHLTDSIGTWAGSADELLNSVRGLCLTG